MASNMFGGADGKRLVTLLTPDEVMQIMNHQMDSGRSGSSRGSSRGRGGRGVGGRRGGATRGGRVEKKPQPCQDYVPILKGWQLVGDSLMNKVALVALRAQPTFSSHFNAKQLGLGIGGQTCAQLKKLLMQRHCPKLLPKAVLMVGSNDIIKNVPVDNSAISLERVVAKLKEDGNENLVICTVPPILKATPEQSERLAQLNDKIKSLATGNGVAIFDVFPLFMNENEIKAELFE